MKEPNECIHYSVSLVNKNISILFDNFRNVCVYTHLFGSRTLACNHKGVIAEIASPRTCTVFRTNEQHARGNVYALAYQHNARGSRLALPGIPLIYMREKRAKVEVREFNIRPGSRKMLVPDLSPAILCRTSQSGSSQLERLRSLITDDLRAIGSRFRRAPMQSRTASRDGKCFLSDNFISLSLQLRRGVLPTYRRANPPLLSAAASLRARA